MTRCIALVVFAFAVLRAADAQPDIAFTDVTDQVGLAQPLERWRVAHAAAWGDADGDGRPDLYLGAFADRPLYSSRNAPIPNPLFLNGLGGFVLSPQLSVRLAGRHARTTMALFVDLDNDGDLDLFAGNNVQNRRDCESALFENLGAGRFREVTSNPPPWPAGWSVRNASALDFNSDGLLDLILTDGSYARQDRGTGRLLVLENRGQWRFEEVSARYGLPAGGTAGLGMAVGDVNNDGVFDIFVANDNRLFVSRPDGRYAACPSDLFPARRGEALPCGAAFGDLNGDDRLDLVLTIHAEPGEFYVYLNKGVRDGMPELAEVTRGRFPRKSPITGLPVKAAQVSLADMDNDGRRDIFIAVTWRSDNGAVQPLILRNEGNTPEGVPRFRIPLLERCLGYYAPAPVADYDRDGRQDIFLPSWFDELPNCLFRNTTDGGHWLTVRVRGRGPGLNSMGIGAIVRVYRAGKAGEPEHLLGRHDISVGNGFSSGEEALAHFGLGQEKECDVLIEWQGQRRVVSHAEADQFLTVDVPAAE